MKFKAPLTALLFITLFISKSAYSQKKQKVSNLTIAFYIEDSLAKNFNYFRIQDSIITSKRLSYQTDLEKLNAEMNNYAQSKQIELEKGLLTESDIAQIQHRIKQMENRIIEKQQSIMSFDEETMKVGEQFASELERLSKEYSEKEKIDILFRYNKNLAVSYINPSMDVTEDFTEFVNKKSKLE